MERMTIDEGAVNYWNKCVKERAEEVDPDDERDWYDLALGFFLGMGMTVEMATEYALEVTYRRQ